MKRTTGRFVPIILVACGIVACGFSGCSQEEQAPQPVVRKAVPAEPPKAAEAAKSSEAPAPKPVSLYSPAGKRDPFVPFIKVETREARAGLENVPPLQRYELGELRFVGVIWGPKTVYALVEDAEGRGYTVTVGMKIGRGGGTVMRILDGEIVVKEETRDNTGAKVVRQSSMKIQSAGGK